MQIKTQNGIWRLGAPFIFESALSLMLMIYCTSIFGQSSPSNSEYSLICISKTDSLDGQAVQINVESQPIFPGGEIELFKYLNKEIRELSFSEQFSYSLYVTFIIDTMGIVRHPCITSRSQEKINDQLYKQVEKIFNEMPKWKPGEMKDRKVPVRFILPINLVGG